MFNPHCAVIAAFERKYRKYLLIVSVIEAEELLSLFVAFMDLKDLLALTTSCRQMQSLLHVPFIELRILRAKVKCLGNFTHSQRYNTEEVEEDEKMTIYSHPQILLNVKPKCFKGLIQQLKALNNSRKKQEIKQSVAIPPETTNNDLPPPKLAEPSRKNFKSKYTQ